MEATSPVPTQVLHLIGSPTSQWYFDLSMMYGRTCAECPGLDRASFTHRYMVVYPSGKVAFPSKLDVASVEAAMASSVGIGAAMARVEAMHPHVDVVVPHMFCLEGMTRYRALCDMLGIEVLGCSPEACAVGQDKFLTKAVCQAAGVPVPKGELLKRDLHGADVLATARGVLERRSPPFIVKPAREDNSIGLSLVRGTTQEDVAKALSKAFQYDDHVLVEEYIAGREVRVAVLEMENAEGSLRLEVLPKIEYVLEDIRSQRYKLGTDASGQLIASSDDNPAAAIEKGKEVGDRICPARLEPEVHQRVDELARRAHSALGCKYYSLYDVRINEDGYPFMLESCLFCSFSPYSMIVTLAGKAESWELQPHPRLFELLLRRAARDSRARRTEGSTRIAACGGVRRR